MNILVLSDIHGNLEALQACLAAAPAHDKVFNLGDVVGYGASPNEVVELSRSLGGVIVRGNHDKACSGVTDPNDFNHIAALAAMWTREHLTPDNLEWVKNLPQGPVKPEMVGDVSCVHGSPLDEDEYIIVVRDSYEPLNQATDSVTFFGHTHIQGGFCVNDGQWLTLRPVFETENEPESFVYPLRSGAKYLINPGSVGQPRDGDWRAAFCLFDTAAYTVTYHRVPYDVDSAMNRIFAANLPDRLATRLRDGR